MRSANVVIEYKDIIGTGETKQWWLYNYPGRDVQDIGEEIVQAVHDCSFFVNNDQWLTYLLGHFPRKFEDATGLRPGIEFLYRVTYADNEVTVVARYGGYADKDAEQHYSRENDTLDNSVELYRATLQGGMKLAKDAPDNEIEFRTAEPNGDIERQVASFRYEIREPEDWIRELIHPHLARKWRGQLRPRMARI